MKKFKSLFLIGLTLLLLVLAINFGGASQMNVMNNNTIDPVPIPYSIEQNSTIDMTLE